MRHPLPARELDPQERLDWLRLCRTETIGPVSFYAMLRRFGSARAAIEMLRQLAGRGERSKTVIPVTRADAEAELAALQRFGARLVCWGEPIYPRALMAIEDAPPILTVLGRAELLTEPIIAVVGARNASASVTFCSGTQPPGFLPSSVRRLTAASIPKSGLTGETGQSEPNAR